jgi:hypothetical protein
MAGAIGDVVVRVGSDITDLRKGMADGSRSVGQFSAKAGSELKKTVANLAKVGAAATAAGAAMVAGLYRKGAQVVDQQAKLARSMGSTVASIQAMDRAAELAGVSQGGLANAAGKLNARLGEAMRGTGQAAAQLDRLSLSAHDLADMEADERLATLADRMNELGYNTAQVGDALKQFGIREEQIVALMMEGGEAFRAARREVEEFGIAVSDVEAAQIEAANDAMTSIQATIQGVANTIAIQLSPYLQEIGERFGAMSKESGGFKSQIESLIESGLKGFGKLGNVIHGLRVVFKGLEVVAVGFGAAIVSAAELGMEGITWLNDNINTAVNEIIRALNKIPGVNIGELGMFTNSDFMKDLRELGDQARNQVGVVRSELHELAMQELPSDKIDQFLADVAQRAQETAAEVVAARNQMVTMPENEMGGGDDAEAEKQQRALEAIRNRYMTEQELLRQHQEQMAIIGEEFDAAKFGTEEEWRVIREQAEQDHMDKLFQIRQQGMSRIQKFQSMSMQQQVQTVTGALANMTAGVANENKRMFELNKKAGIANAIISAYQGISTTLGAYPAPLSFAMAAVQAAAAFAQVNAIRSQSFGGGGSTAPSLAGGTPAPATTPVTGGTPPGQGGQVMRVEGLDKNSLFSGDAVQTIAQGLIEFQKDGGQVVFDG